MSRLLEDTGGLAFVWYDGGEHSSMRMAYIFNEGSEGGLLQSALVYLAGTGGREILKNHAFGLFMSVDTPKDSASSLPPSSALSPISLPRATTGRAKPLWIMKLTENGVPPSRNTRAV